MHARQRWHWPNLSRWAKMISRAQVQISILEYRILRWLAARRAKEAGLRAMWVNEKGDLMGNIGPKEAGILKQDRKSRYRQKSQGQYATSTYEQQQQPMMYTGQDMSYRGGQGGGQGYPPPVRQPHPMGASEHYDNALMPQQPSHLHPQSQPRRMGPQHTQGQYWNDYHSVYDSPQSLAAGPRKDYAQGRSQFEAKNPSQVKGDSPQAQRPSAGGYASGYDRHEPEDEVEGAPYRGY